MTADETLPGLRWYVFAHAFGRDDHGYVFPSHLGAELAETFAGAPMSWYRPAGTLDHIPAPHAMDVHRVHEVALVESAWPTAAGVEGVIHFYLPLSPRADEARRALLEAEAAGSLGQWPHLSVMVDVGYRWSGSLKVITRVVRVTALDFVHRPAAEGRLIRSLRFDEDICPTDSAVRHFAEIAGDHDVRPGGDAA